MDEVVRSNIEPEESLTDAEVLAEISAMGGEYTVEGELYRVFIDPGADEFRAESVANGTSVAPVWVLANGVRTRPDEVNVTKTPLGENEDGGPGSGAAPSQIYSMSDTTRTPFDEPMIHAAAPVMSLSDAPDALTAGEKSWRELSVALAACLRDLDEDDYIIISHKFSGAFVQFVSQGAYGMRFEAVSNAYLPPQNQLAPEDQQRLLALGWQAPTYVQKEGVQEPSDGSPNYYVDAEPPVAYLDVAQSAIQGLRLAYHVRHPGELQYKANDIDGGPIRFPSLKLKRQPPELSPETTATEPRAADPKPSAKSWDWNSPESRAQLQVVV